MPIILKCHTVDASEIPGPTTERMVRKNLAINGIFTISIYQLVFSPDFGTIKTLMVENSRPNSCRFGGFKSASQLQGEISSPQCHLVLFWNELMINDSRISTMRQQSLVKKRI